MRHLLVLLLLAGAVLAISPVWADKKPAARPYPVKPVEKEPANPPKKEALLPGGIDLKGVWDVQLTEEQAKTRGGPYFPSLYAAKQFVFSDKALIISRRQFALPWGFALDTTAKPARLKLWIASGPLRQGLHMKYHVCLLPCLVERVDAKTIRIAFKRSALVVKPLITIGPRRSRPGPGGRGGRGRFDPRKPIPETMVNAKTKGAELQYPEKITHFGDLKGDLVVIPLRRAKPEAEDKKAKPPAVDKKPKPEPKDSKNVVQCVVESASLEHRKCPCRVRGCNSVTPYYKIVLTDKAAGKTHTVNTSWNFNLKKGELVDFNTKTTKIYKEGTQHPYYTRNKKRAGTRK